MNYLDIFIHLNLKAGLMGLNNISEIAHKMEDLLDLLRSIKVKLTKKEFDILFLGLDYIQEGISRLAKKWEDFEINEKLINKFESVINFYKGTNQKIKNEENSEDEVHELSIDDLLGDSSNKNSDLNNIKIFRKHFKKSCIFIYIFSYNFRNI